MKTVFRDHTPTPWAENYKSFPQIPQGLTLLEATKSNSVFVPALIARGDDLEQGRPLRVATYLGHTEAALALIKAGASLDVKDFDEGRTALIWASYYGYTQIALALIQAGANVNLQDQEGSTALMMAATFQNQRHTEIVQALIAAGADLNKHDCNGFTAITTAIYCGHTEIAEALRAAGATE